MKKYMVLISLGTVLLTTALVGNADTNHAKAGKLSFQNLLTNKIAGVKNKEVIISRVVIPPNTTLPRHWHPGEEFAYVLKGKVTLWQKGKKDIVGNQGDVVKVPLKQIHTAITKSEGAEILVFRIHEIGKPNRYKVK